MERLLALLGNALQFAYTCECTRKRSLGLPGGWVGRIAGSISKKMGRPC
jgi:hypothetical protein